MARTCTNAALDTISGRRRLAPRSAPYWRSIRLGLRVGWRRQADDAAGVWLCRLALPGNDIRQKVLGGADDPPVRADAAGVLNYRQAVDAAQSWAAGLLGQAGGKAAGPSASMTVLAALRAYQAEKKTACQEDRASAAETLIRRHLPAPLAGTRCSELTEEVLKEWLRTRTDSARPDVSALSQGTRDKLRGIMGAALRAAGAPARAVQAGLNAAAAATGGQRADASARHTILDGAQLGRLHTALATLDADLALLARALDETGNRPVQLLGMTIADLDATHCLLHVPASAKGKPGSARRPAVSVPITPGLVRDLTTAALLDGKEQRLFTRPLKMQVPGTFAAWRDTGTRTPWTKNVWARPFQEAVLAADLPMDTTLYSLRHSRVVAMIQANVPLRIIASMTDTSTAMIEKHYSRWIARTADAVAQVRRVLGSTAGKAA